MIATWQAPLSNGKTSEELLLRFDRQRDRRILILPALFDEANKLRRLTVQIMRLLDAAGIDTFLPDLPGCNESLQPLSHQTLASWRECADAAAKHFSATHILTIRAGALLAPPHIPGWHYAPHSGPKTLRGLLRARMIAAREAGREETSDQLLDAGRKEGLVLAGWSVGADMLRELEFAEPTSTDQHQIILQKSVGGGGLWLRAEPDDDQDQAAALVAIITGSEAEPA